MMDKTYKKYIISPNDRCHSEGIQPSGQTASLKTKLI